MGIEIANLRAEVQALVNSAPAKYDPNANGMIDNGEELSLLLSEYQCDKSKLTSRSNFEDRMWTQAELIEIDKISKKEAEASNKSVDIIGGATFGIGVVVAAVMSLIAGATEPYENVPKLKKISDGSFIPGAQPAADIYSYDSKPYMVTHVGGAGSRTEFKTLQELADSWCPTTGVVQGKGGLGYDGLRHWQPGDPQFIKDMKDTITIKSNRPKQLFKKAGLIGGGIMLLGLVGSAIAKHYIADNATEKAKRQIKAAQTKMGADLMDQTRARQEEMRQREKQIQKDEVEYRERMEKATKKIERNVSSAHNKAILLNKELQDVNDAKNTLKN